MVNLRPWSVARCSRKRRRVSGGRSGLASPDGSSLVWRGLDCYFLNAVATWDFYGPLYLDLWRRWWRDFVWLNRAKWQQEDRCSMSCWWLCKFNRLLQSVANWCVCLGYSFFHCSNQVRSVPSFNLSLRPSVHAASGPCVLNNSRTFLFRRPATTLL